MKKIRVILAGGFLGAGKTTSVIRLADILEQKGIKAGIITNDQGSRLVDGSLVKLNGITGTEVTGGCFCCRFDDLVRGMDLLMDKYDPDVLIAEPVGSCTDLVSTVFLPLHAHYPGKFVLAPFTVVADGLLLNKLMSDKDFPFSADIRYLYEKQLEEADIILLNKTDTLGGQEKQQLVSQLASLYPGKEIIQACAINGEGFMQWADHLLEGNSKANPLKELDYDRYGHAESLLGWYNASIGINGDRPFDPNDFVSEFLDGVSASVGQAGGKTAHIKVMAESDGGVVKASAVDGGEGIHFTRSAYDLTSRLELLINARVELDPALLGRIIGSGLEKLCERLSLHMKQEYVECFKPSYPTPTHRGA